MKPKEETLSQDYTKTKDDILNQDYITPQDLKIIMPTLGIDKCRNIINEVRNDMELKNLFVPQTKPKIALTKLVQKKCGF